MPADSQLLNLIWMVGCSALVMLMQGGFCLLETGATRAKNSINVAIKNLIDFCISGAIYWLFGFAVMFGVSHSGIIGTTGFAVDTNDSAKQIAFFIFQLTFCGTATTIISGAVAERIKFPAYPIIATLVSSIFYPLFGHWAWNGADNAVTTGWLNSRGYIDFAGSSVVHGIGGWISLAAVLVIGPRIGRFGKDGKNIDGHNLPMATVGVMVLWFGWFGFNGGSTLGITESIPRILLTTNLAAAFGGVVGLGLAWAVERRANASHCMNGVVAGLVAITASCHITSAPAAALIGAIGGVVSTLGTYGLARLRIDDAVGAVPVHALSGTWGILAVALLGNANEFGTGLDRWQQLMIQAEGAGLCLAWGFGGGLACLSILNCFYKLRVSEEAEIMGLNIVEHGASTELFDLVNVIRNHQSEDQAAESVDIHAGSEVGLVAMEYHKVLEQMKSEIKERKEAEQKWKQIFDNAIEGIFQSTPDGNYLTVNPALARMYGFDSPEALIKHFSNIADQLYVDPNRRFDFQRELEANAVLEDFESEVKCVDGRIIWISETARAYRDESGNIKYYEGTVEDITQRKQAEQYFRDKEQAEAACVAKSQFLATMSHEIRTPLNGVIGMLDMLTESEMNSSQQRYVRIAKSSASILLRLINEILDYSKIEAGKLELDVIEFDFYDLVESIPDIFIQQAKQKGNTIGCFINPHVPRIINGAPERLQQVLVNLIGNAVKFTENGSVDINVDLVAVEGSEEKRLKIKVKDSGIGIPEDKLPNLFQCFTQVDASTTRKFGGTGLGLAISKELIELMGGSVSVESTLGVGSTFSIDLPLHASSGSESLVGMHESRRVMIVSKNEATCELVRTYLQSWEMDFAIAKSVEEAMQILSSAEATENPFDVVVLDELFAEQEASPLLERLQSKSKSSLIYLASLGVEVDPTEASEANLQVLQKPVRQSVLYDAICRSRVASDEIATPEHSWKSLRGGKVLVVDDNEVNRVVAYEMLTLAGYQVAEESDGAKAVEAIKSNTFDVVLMDCEMPNMDGFAATRVFREIETSLIQAGHEVTRLPIIALTAQAVEGDRERCLAAGMTDYVTKPIHKDTLLKLISKLIGDAHAPNLNPEVSREFLRKPQILVDELRDRCSGSEAAVKRVLGMFRKKIDDDKESLSTAMTVNDFDKVRAMAHNIKGSAANVSAFQLSVLAGEMELAAGSRKREMLADLYQRIDRSFDECQEAIDEILSN